MFESVRERRRSRSRLDVFVAAFGLTFCVGFFLLPGFSYAEGGAATIVAHILAGLVSLPAIISVVELSSSMPEESGIHRYLTRGAGSMAGTVTALAIWIWLILLGALAIAGAADYVAMAVTGWPEIPLDLVVALLITAMVALGIGNSAGFRTGLVLFIIPTIVFLVVWGLASASILKTFRIFEIESASLLRSSGILITGYAGLIYAAVIFGRSRSGRNAGTLISLLVVFAVVFVAGALVTVSAIPAGQLVDNLSAVAMAGKVLAGAWGGYSVAAVAVIGLFFAAAAAISVAARLLVELSLDTILPPFFSRRVSVGKSPSGVLMSGAGVLICLILFEPLLIARLAGSILMLLVLLLCVGVLILRESHVEWYAPMRPGPAYPWLQIAGIIATVILVAKLGSASVVAVLCVVILGVIIHRIFPADRTERGGAVYHWFARLGEQQYAGLDRELRGILKEKGLREEDPFDEIVARSSVIESEPDATFESVVQRAASLAAPVVNRSADYITESFLEGTRIGATPVTHGVALPHFRVIGLRRPEMVIVRSKTGLHVVSNDPILGYEEEHDVNAVFFLISPEEDPGQHLRLLAQIAGRVDDAHFMDEWLEATDAQQLREVLLRDDRFMSLYIERDSPSSELIRMKLKEIKMPEGSLIAMIRRNAEILVPDGNTVLHEGDRLTIIGGPDALREIRSRFVERRRE